MINRFSTTAFLAAILLIGCTTETKKELLPVQEPQPPPPPDNVKKEKAVRPSADAPAPPPEENNTPGMDNVSTFVDNGIQSPDRMPVTDAPDLPPEFPGGNIALIRYLRSNLRYPKTAQESSVSGKVQLSFIVQKNGSISDIRLLKTIGAGCDEEAVRLIKSMPAWKPGQLNGVPVNTRYNLPVQFTLQ